MNAAHLAEKLRMVRELCDLPPMVNQVIDEAIEYIDPQPSLLDAKTVVKEAMAFFDEKLWKRDREEGHASDATAYASAGLHRVHKEDLTTAINAKVDRDTTAIRFEGPKYRGIDFKPHEWRADPVMLGYRHINLDWFMYDDVYQALVFAYNAHMRATAIAQKAVDSYDPRN